MKPPGPQTYEVKTSYLSSIKRLPSYSLGQRHKKSIFLLNDDPSKPDPFTYIVKDGIRGDGKVPLAKFANSKNYSFAMRTDDKAF